GRAVPHLPIAVHFVAQAPIFHFPRFFAAVLLARRDDGGVLIAVDIFNPLLGIRPSAGPEVQADIWFRADFIDIIQEFMGAETIALDSAPSHFEPLWPAIARSDAIAPI